MVRQYKKWYSPALQREMELLVFGDRGTQVLFFPTRKAHFYDYENWGVIGSLAPQIDQGQFQIICVDSYDAESFYATHIPPQLRILNHIKYETYIVEEVIPFMQKEQPQTKAIVAGCSLGAYHAMNLALRHPYLFCKFVGMSGRYDLTQAMGSFRDLFEGYINDDIYFHMPNRFLPQLQDEKYLQPIRALEMILAIGEEDAFLEDNRFMSQTLAQKNIPHQLYIWSGESHNPCQWKDMVKFYF